MAEAASRGANVVVLPVHSQFSVLPAPPPLIDHQLTYPGMLQLALRHGILPKVRGAHPWRHWGPPARVDPVV